MHTLVMTGGTRGLGRAVVDRVLALPDWRIIVFARGASHLSELSAAVASRVDVVAADLANLHSVQRACRDVLDRLAGSEIAALALNAGMQSARKDLVSTDGFELHFAVNHLAHVLIADQLAPRITQGGRIIITTSGLHDPWAFCIVPISRAAWQDPTELADAKLAQARLRGDANRGEARYCASKLCNVMHARALAAQYPNLACASFTPGVLPGTDIARDRDVLQHIAWRWLLPVLAPVLPGVRSLARSSGDLVWLTTEAQFQGVSGSFFDGRRPRPGSRDSRDKAKISRLMDVSRSLITTALQQERSEVGSKTL
jgi:NAD(P)-dependent dehydrogenase (short-subunit alcohol dehydrogenase family)